MTFATISNLKVTKRVNSSVSNLSRGCLDDTCEVSSKNHTYRALFKPDSLNVFEGFHDAIQGDGRALGYAQAWHRNAVEKHTVINEFIAASIGQFIRLPIPPFAITNLRDEKLFSSLDFNFTRAKLPAVIPSKLWDFMPDEATGIIVFDILIANEDRHDTNLVADRISRPKNVFVYDHDQSLFSGYTRSGCDRLEAEKNNLGIIKTFPDGRTQDHCLMEVIDSDIHFKKWTDRISTIPDWFINDICKASKPLGANRDEVKAVAEFIISRRNSILDIIGRHKSEFKSIENWNLTKDLLGWRFTY